MAMTNRNNQKNNDIIMCTIDELVPQDHLVRIQHAKDRNYICRCGYHTHRDLLGAINISRSTEYIGNRYTA